MPVDFVHFPVVNIVEGLISFLRFQFSSPDVVPSTWIWHDSNKKTNVIIQADYVYDEETPDQIPTISVTRGSFGNSNSLLDNLEKADPNTFANPQRRDWLVGTIDVIVTSRSKYESECVASFCAGVIHQNRHALISNITPLKQISSAAIGPAVQAIGPDVKTRRWSTTVRFNTELNLVWVISDMDIVTFDKLDVYSVDEGTAIESKTGSIAIGSTYLVDPEMDFGLLNTNAQHFNEAELLKGWYYCFLDGYNTKYTVKSIVDNHTLELCYTDGANPYPDNTNPIEHADAFTGHYKIVWNDVHFSLGVPTK